MRKQFKNKSLKLKELRLILKVFSSYGHQLGWNLKYRFLLNFFNYYSIML